MKIFESKFFIFCVLIGLAFVLFGNGIGGDFVFDDRSVIADNPLIEEFSGVFKSFLNPYHYARPQSGLYRPLTFASFVVDWHIFSGNPAGFHVVNIILHAIASFLVFLIVLDLSARDKLISGWQVRKVALVSSLLFLFLPVHVESVTSIVGRGELLAFLFFAMSFYMVQKRCYKTAAVLFLFSVLSKETGIIFIPIFIFFEIVWRKISMGESFKKALYLLPPLIIYVVFRYNALGSNYFMNNEAYTFFNPILAIDFLPGLWTAFKVLFLYVKKIIFPTYFSSDYSYNQIVAVNNLFDSWQTVAGVIILGTILYLSVSKRNNLLGLGSFIFLVSYLVISNLFIKIGTIMAERLMYMPSFGFVLAASDYISRACKIRARPVKQVLPVSLRALFILFLILLIVYGVKVVRGNTLWKNEKTLFENAYKHAPNSVVNITNMASIFFREGKNEEALKTINAALEIEPRNSPALHLAGQIYKKMGENKVAEEFWLKAIQAQSDYLYPYLSLGALYYQKSDFKSGETILLKTKETYSTPNVIALLAFNQIGLEKYSEAINLIEEKFGTKPSEYELRFILGVAYLKSGDSLRSRELLLELKDPALIEADFFKNLRNTKIFNVEI